jgi:hypothetical protein
MWVWQGQKSFQLTREQYNEKIDAVAQLVNVLGQTDKVRPRPRGGGTAGGWARAGGRPRRAPGARAGGEPNPPPPPTPPTPPRLNIPTAVRRQVRAFLSAPAKSQKGLPRRPVVGTAISIQLDLNDAQVAEWFGSGYD